MRTTIGPDDSGNSDPRISSCRDRCSIDPGLLEAIDDEARQRRMTRSPFLAAAARLEIERT